MGGRGSVRCYNRERSGGREAYDVTVGREVGGREAYAYIGREMGSREAHDDTVGREVGCREAYDDTVGREMGGQGSVRCAGYEQQYHVRRNKTWSDRRRITTSSYYAVTQTSTASVSLTNTTKCRACIN